MKQIITTSRNISFAFNEEKGTFDAFIEGVIVLMEPSYTPTFEGIAKEQKTETIRFSIGPEALRHVSEQFDKWADDAESQLEKIRVMVSDRQCPTCGDDVK